MNLVSFALRRPVTVLVLVVAAVLVGVVAFVRMPRDVFPDLGVPPRCVVINTDPDRLRACSMSPEEVVAAGAKGNLISRSGNVRIGDTMPIVPVNPVVGDVKQLGDVPSRSDGTRTVFVRDIGTVED